MALADGGALALTANGGRSEGMPESMKLWNPAKDLPVASLPIGTEQFGNVRCGAAVFSAGARMVASSQISVYQGIRPSYGNAMLRLWERTSGQPIRTLAPTITNVVAFSANGRLLAAGTPGKSGHLRVGYGSGIDIWETVSGKKAGTLAVTPQCVAFSPDGSQLGTAGRDHSILMWVAPTMAPGKATPPSAGERDAWWTGLGGEAKDAYKIIEQMLDVPEDAVALLKERVRPVEAGDPQVVARLIAQLDSKSFKERVEAENALEKLGEGAAHLLRKALDDKVSLELRRRLEALLLRCEATSTAGLQHHRAVAVLEWIATPAARDVLRTLADGAPQARLTLEARGALKRLQG
jgi:hypothetical protein